MKNKNISQRVSALLFDLKGTKAFILSGVAMLILLLSLSCAKHDLSGPASDTEAERRDMGEASADTSATDGEAASPDEEESWFLVTEINGDRNYAVFVDTSTINTIDGAVHSWSKLVFEEDQKDSDGLVYREVRIASAINCENRKYMYLSSKFYDSLGKMVYMENISNNWSDIPGGTVSEHIADFVCGNQPPKSPEKN